MLPRSYSGKFVVLAFLVSIMLHTMVVVTVYLLPDRHRLTLPIPVDIVNLPEDLARRLPPLERPAPVRPPVPAPVMPKQTPPRPVPEKPLPPAAVPKPEQFGGSDDVTLPRTGSSPRTGVPGGADEGAETGKAPDAPAPGTGLEQQKSGPLPFLSQNDIDHLARKGMPARKPGDDSVTLDTDEFKFISYNRWLKIKVESVLKYPELAAISGYQGTLFIKFDILKDGSLGEFNVLKSSGYKILDDEAERSIRAAAPFQPLPSEWNMERYSIRAAVIFFLGQGYIR
jgi:protein TonB